jgi:hypothetical protein
MIWPELLQVLWVLGGKVAPEEQVVDSCLREERSWLVLLLRVEDFSEMKGNQQDR